MMAVYVKMAADVNLTLLHPLPKVPVLTKNIKFPQPEKSCMGSAGGVHTRCQFCGERPPSWSKRPLQRDPEK